jgi:RHS repeat-associated protein
VYSFGFNGMEKDDDVNGATGTSYDFGARIYDTRVGRWLSLDPVVSGAPGITPYRFGLNNPLLYSDPSGGFEVPVHKRMTMVVALMSQLSTAQSLALVLGVQNADYLGFAEDWHFDGRDDFEAVQRTCVSFPCIRADHHWRFQA